MAKKNKLIRILYYFFYNNYRIFQQKMNTCLKKNNNMNNNMNNHINFCNYIISIEIYMYIHFAI